MELPINSEHRRNDGTKLTEISYKKVRIMTSRLKSLSQEGPPLCDFLVEAAQVLGENVVFIAKVMDARGLSAQSHAEDLDVPGSHIISDISFVPKK